jgi:hypothetical protein
MLDLVSAVKKAHYAMHQEFGMAIPPEDLVSIESQSTGAGCVVVLSYRIGNAVDTFVFKFSPDGDVVSATTRGSIRNRELMSRQGKKVEFEESRRQQIHNLILSEIKTLLRGRLTEADSVGEIAWQCLKCKQPDVPPGVPVTTGICEKCQKIMDQDHDGKMDINDLMTPNDKIKESFSLIEVFSGSGTSDCDCGHCVFCHGALEDYDPEDALDMMVPSDEEENKERMRTVSFPGT